METVDVEKINEVEAEGDKPLDQSALLVERIVQVEPQMIDSSKAEECPASETCPANETDPRPAEERPANETDPPKVKTRPASETSRKGTRKSNTEKVRCDKCLREFNPAYLSRHICKPCVVRPASETSNEPIVEETPPIPPPIIRETTAIIRPASETPEGPRSASETPELTAADVAAFLRKQKVAQRAEQMAKYSAAMFGA